jgi:uncharacterized membrane protein
MSDWLLFLHVLAAMLWTGGTAVLAAFALRILRREHESAGRFVASLRYVGPLVLAPSLVVVLATGVWQVADLEAWSFGQLWVQLALGLLAAVFLVGVVHQSRAAIAAERAAGAGDDAETLRQLRRWTWGTALNVVLLVAATWDMVFKPGL